MFAVGYFVGYLFSFSYLIVSVYVLCLHCALFRLFGLLA